MGGNRGGLWRWNKRIYNNFMQTKLVWDETKRQSNLIKHGLDFADAADVLDARYRLDVDVVRGSELRTQSFAYVMGVLRVLTVVHTARMEDIRIISFRPASQKESEDYYEWIANTMH